MSQETTKRRRLMPDWKFNREVSLGSIINLVIVLGGGITFAVTFAVTAQNTDKKIDHHLANEKVHELGEIREDITRLEEVTNSLDATAKQLQQMQMRLLDRELNPPIPYSPAYRPDE